jgi:hypothetical protein
MCVTLSASVTLVFLFMPKLYIIVLRPERNNRALFTTSKSIRCHIGARVAAAIAEPPPKRAVYRIAEPLEAESSSGKYEPPLPSQPLYIMSLVTLKRHPA